MNLTPEGKFYSVILHLQDPLFRNSFFISLSRFSEIGFGFIFWVVAARFYTISDVGEATAIISSLGLVVILSRFGFDVSQIRFMKEYDRDVIFNTCLWIPTIGAIIIGGIYFAFLRYTTPASEFLHGYFFLFIIVVFLNSITLTIGNAFISFGKAEYRFVQNLMLGIRIPVMVFLVSLGSIGIFLSFGIAYLITVFFAVWLIRKFVLIKFTIDKDFTRETSRFTYLNYFASLFLTIPILIMPLVILSVSTAENAALYYIAFAFGNIVLVIPEAIGTSFFVEGSQGSPVKKGILKALIMTFLILIPAVLFLWCFGENILQWMGKDYTGALDLLRIFILSGFFVSVSQIFLYLETLRKEPGIVFLFSGLKAVLLIIFSYCFLLVFGIIGIGWAWILTHAILCIYVVWFLRKHILKEMIGHTLVP
jgi:O-antigen/teichoic acid export membrane protein